MTNYTKLEEELNTIKYEEVGIGSLLALELFLLSSETYKKKNLKGYLVFMKIILRAFLTKIPVFLNKNILYYKSGDKNHHNQIFNSINSISKGVILTGGTIDATINSSVFNINFKNYIELIKWKNNSYNKFKLILNRNGIEKNILSLYVDLLINLLRFNFWDAFFQRNKIKLLLGDYDRGNASAPIFVAAKKYKTPSVVIQHGVINPPYGYTPLIADIVFVWGKMQKKQYLELGVTDERIVITGTPIVSKIATINKVKLNTKKNIVLAVNPIKKEYIKQQIDTFSQLAQKDNYNLYIKVHPSQNVSTVKKMLDNEFIKILSKDIKFSDFVNMCDVLVTHNSGLANECILNEIPVIILDNLPISAGNGVELNTFCNVPLVNNVEQLNKQIITIDKLVIKKENLYYKTGLEAEKEIQKQILKIYKPVI